MYGMCVGMGVQVGVGMCVWDVCRDGYMGWVYGVSVRIGVVMGVGISVWGGCSDGYMG